MWNDFPGDGSGPAPAATPPETLSGDAHPAHPAHRRASDQRRGGAAVTPAAPAAQFTDVGDPVTQDGSLFAVKAAIPSRPSAEEKSRPDNEAVHSKASSIGIPGTWRSSDLVAANAPGPPRDTRSQYPRTRSSTWSTASTSESRPASSMVCADTRWPVNIRRAASRGRIRIRTTTETTAGATPTRTSENANRAESAATARSQAATNPLPPPKTSPRTEAISGLGNSSISVNNPARARGADRANESSPPSRAARISAPAQNVGPVDARTTTRTFSSPASRWMTVRRALIVSASNTLRRSGRFNVTVAIPPSITETTGSVVRSSAGSTISPPCSRWQSAGPAIVVSPIGTYPCADSVASCMRS